MQRSGSKLGVPSCLTFERATALRQYVACICGIGVETYAEGWLVSSKTRASQGEDDAQSASRYPEILTSLVSIFF